MADIVLKLTNLSKRFGNISAVDKISLSIQRGEVFGFLGPNGAGKTTTIGMILGLINPSSGSVEIFGQEVTPDHTNSLKNVGALIGSPGLIPYLSGRENLKLLARLSHRVEQQRVQEVLKEVGMMESSDRSFITYSTGMKQRLGLAAALLHRPSLLVLDEPTNGLDPAGMKQVRDLVRRHTNNGGTVFLSSHLLHEVEQICDRVAILDRGRIVVEATVDDLVRENQGADLESVFLELTQ